MKKIGFLFMIFCILIFPSCSSSINNNGSPDMFDMIINYDYTTEDDALVLGLEDQVLIEDIYGGTWKLTDLLNYRFVFNTRLPEQTNIIVTYTISETVE